MIRVVYPGSGSWLFTHPGSRIQGWKRHRNGSKGCVRALCPVLRIRMRIQYRGHPDPDLEKYQDMDQGSGMNIPDHFSERLETVFPKWTACRSVPDPETNPDPDPPDLNVFGSSGSGSTSQRYGSGTLACRICSNGSLHKNFTCMSPSRSHSDCARRFLQFPRIGTEAHSVPGSDLLKYKNFK